MNRHWITVPIIIAILSTGSAVATEQYSRDVQSMPGEAVKRYDSGIYHDSEDTASGDNHGGGFAAAYASCSVVPNYAGPLFELTRLSDQTAQTFSAEVDGRPNLVAIEAFTQNTVGYVTKIFDQSGNGNDVSQTVLASAPYMDLTRRLAGGCPPIVADGSRRNYAAALGPFIGTAIANVIAIAGTPRFPGPLPPGLAPGMTVTGVNIPPGDTITAVDYANNTLTLAAAPTAPLSHSLASNVALWNPPSAGQASFTVNGTLPGWLAPGAYVTGLNIPTADRIQGVRYDSKTDATTVTVTAPPNGPASDLVLSAAISLAAPRVFMDLPRTVSAPFDDHSLFAVTRPGGVPRTVPVALGVSANTVRGSEAFDQFVLNGFDLTSSFRIIGPNAYNYNVPTTTFTHKGAVDLYGFTRSGSAIHWYAEESAGTASVKAADSTPLVGGSLFYSLQFPCDNDAEMYATLIYPTAITAAQEHTLRREMIARFDIHARVRRTLSFDGSSTTAGNGTDMIENTSHMTSDLIYGAYRNRPFTLALSGLIEGEDFALPVVAALQKTTPEFDPREDRILVYHPGLGNSIMVHASAPISQQDGNVLTISATGSSGAATPFQGDPFGIGLLPGLYVTGTDSAGNSVIPPNTRITAASSSWTGAKVPFRITLSNAPTGTVANVTSVSDTGAVAWDNIKTYIAHANAAGFRVVLIGSASRWWFESNSPLAPMWRQEFRNAKALMANGWKAAGAIAYVDLESDHAFGADTISGTDGTDTRMKVTAVDAAARQVTLARLGKHTAVGNYVAWPGMMPPAPYIQAISGNRLTLSQTPPSRLAEIRGFDPVPWEHYPAYWNLDGQHFTYAGYRRISEMTAKKLLDGILDGKDVP